MSFSGMILYNHFHEYAKTYLCKKIHGSILYNNGKNGTIVIKKDTSYLILLSGFVPESMSVMY